MTTIAPPEHLVPGGLDTHLDDVAVAQRSAGGLAFAEA